MTRKRPVIDLERERRIRTHLTALADMMRTDPETAQLVCNVLNAEGTMETSINLVKLPTDLVKRAEAQWEWLMAVPEFRAAAPRRSGAAAVRMLLELKLTELESDADRQRRRAGTRSKGDAQPGGTP